MPILDSIRNALKNTANTIPVFYEETEVARYVVIRESANGISVPDPSAPLPLSDRHIEDINAPGIATDTQAVIYFRTTHTGSPTFSLRMNSTRLSQQTLSQAGPHTWHEIVPAGAIRADLNQLTLAVSSDGSVTFSDIVILYTSNQLTVKKRNPVLVATQ